MLSKLALSAGLLLAGGLPFTGSGHTLQIKTGPGAVTPPASGGAMLVDIILEQKRDGKVEQMAPTHVFKTGDVVRLRLRSHYNGFLYVLDQGSSGKSSTIFPATETGSNNRVSANQEYLVPAVEDGWFEVEGPPGFDVLFFLLSPSEIQPPSPSSLSAPGPASSLKPRCNDNIFKARGECMDETAGPATVPAGKPLPPPLAPLAVGASRDLIFVADANGAVGVTKKADADHGAQAAPDAAPVLYTFRLAHE